MVGLLTPARAATASTDMRAYPRSASSARAAARMLVEGRTVTGFANIEEAAADEAVGTKVMPWHIEDALRARGANYVEGGLWKAFAIRDGRLITGQQQYSGRKVAALVIEALGI